MSIVIKQEDEQDQPENDPVAALREERRQKRSVCAADGPYLYLHSSDGLAKVGSFS
jgi:hypothetical protein